MDFSWLDLPFTFLTLLLATRLAYDYYGAVAATFAGTFSLQIFLFYCFARWYNQTIPPRAELLPSTSRRHDGGDDAGAPPVLTPLLESATGDGGPGAAAASGTLLVNRCLAFVFMVFVPLVIVIFEQSQADVVAYGICLVNIVVMVVWLSPDSAASLSATKSFPRLSDDEDEDDDGEGGGAAEDSCCVCLAGMREEQDLRDLTGCGHRFHHKCIGKWLKAGHPTCPVCRALVSPPPARYADPHDHSVSPV
uniref:Uncharacterized protein n=1 Tax=Avena sativa TaxID=4498 RepID=A0ACD5WU71_AVESA